MKMDHVIKISKTIPCILHKVQLLLPDQQFSWCVMHTNVQFWTMVKQETKK